MPSGIGDFLWIFRVESIFPFSLLTYVPRSCHPVTDLHFLTAHPQATHGFVPQVLTIQNSQQHFHFLGYFPVLYNNIVFTIAKPRRKTVKTRTIPFQLSNISNFMLLLFYVDVYFELALAQRVFIPTTI
jgi:hypothetical protein